ncbi:MAG: Holliday junction branch migration protein RuvA [Bacteroidetes bacterium]|nr:Holliday junction branch migration protein RuvA [Bacteroidota bacterium]
MIGLLRGKILSRKNNEVILDVNGVGYHLFVSKKALENSASNEGENIFYTYLDVKENSLQLFGFADEKEKEIFKLLISVNGIGPKLAHTILANAGFEDIVNLIAGNNRFAFKIPGLGSKKLEVVTMTLKDKIFKLEHTESDTINGGEIGVEKENSRYEALSALLNLGYSRNDAEKIIREVLKENQNTNLNTEELIRKSLEYITNTK